MSLQGEDDFWNNSDVKAFNFDDEEQQAHTSGGGSSNAVSISSTTSPTTTTSSNVKTLGSILAARPSSNEPFLKPSMIICPGDRIEDLLEYLDETIPTIQMQRPKQDPKSHIRDIVYKRAPIDFSSYKSKRDKLLLLDSAICCSDGNTITAVCIFISKTLKPSLFLEEMKKRPIAIDHYINYLEISGRSREATEISEKLSKSK